MDSLMAIILKQLWMILSIRGDPSLIKIKCEHDDRP